MKKNRIIYIAVLVLSVLMTFGITYKFRYKIENSINNIKFNLKVGRKIHKNSNLINKLDSIEDEENAWYTKYHFISHSGGGIDGKNFSNSLEAWNESYEKGNRLFDVDMMFTQDGVLVARHDGINLETTDLKMGDSSIVIDANGILQFQQNNDSNNNFSYDKFINTKIYSKYTPIDTKILIDYLDEHKDLYIIPDMKDNISKSYSYLVREAKKMNKENVLEQIIVSVYDIDSYKKVKKIYNFNNFMLRQHKIDPQNYYELVSFMVNNNIHALNVSQCFMDDEEIIKIKNKGIHIYVAVIDYVSDMEYYKNLGADGAVSNSLYESDWN